MNLKIIKEKFLLRWKAVIAYSTLNVLIKNPIKPGKRNWHIALIDPQERKNN